VNIFKSLPSENRIFRKEEVFLPEFLPDEILHRERELKEIAFAVKALEEGRRQPCVLIFGQPGTGKTCSARYVVKEFTEYSGRAVPVYINCWQNSSRYGVLSRIAQAMDALVPATGITIDDLLRRTKEAVIDSKKAPLVVLDEVDVLQKGGESSVLYDLLRMREIYGINVGLVMITNDVAFASKLDQRTRSSLAQNSVEFRQYTPQQLKDILKERAKMGLMPGTYDDDVIGACAGFGARKGGDARIAIALLWMAGKEAERRNAPAIGIPDIESAKGKLEVGAGTAVAGIGGAGSTGKEAALKDEEKKVLDVIKKGEITSGELYEKLGMNERTVRNYLTRLESLGLIESEERATRGGRTRIFRLKGKKA
jgi:cell division control protein 6